MRCNAKAKYPSSAFFPHGTGKCLRGVVFKGEHFGGKRTWRSGSFTVGDRMSPGDQ